MKKELFAFAEMYYEDTYHALGVANTFKELSDEWIVGLFHDILEDTSVKTEEIMRLLEKYNKGYLYQEIDKITRKRNETYFNYIRRLDGTARKVKIADLHFNLSRRKTLKKSLEERYLKALDILIDII